MRFWNIRTAKRALSSQKNVFLRHFDFGVSKVEKPSAKTWCPRRLLIVSPACHSWHLPPCTPRRREQPQAQWSVGSGKHPAFGRSIPVCIAIDYVMSSFFRTKQDIGALNVCMNRVHRLDGRFRPAHTHTQSVSRWAVTAGHVPQGHSKFQRD